MSQYETIYLLKPDLPQDKLTEIKNKFNQTIASASGKLLAEADWGKRKLAYDVAKEKYAYYIYLRYVAPGELVARLEHLLKLEDVVLKFLTVKVSEQAAQEMTAEAGQKTPEAPEEVLYEKPSAAPRRSYRSYEDRSRRGPAGDSFEGQSSGSQEDSSKE